MKLHIASDLTLPVDIATAVTLIAGKRGSGKTNTAKRLVEQLHAAHVPFGVLDPVDVWWGLKAGRDGEREGGLPIYIFGGKHADYPLAPTGGALMADLFVDYRISAVMALREWSGGERARFVRDFAHRLLERNSEPFVVVAEEAHDLMPQVALGDEKGSLGAMLRMVKLGRSGGIGLVELTQRLAALNKTATTQADVLVIHRTTGPQDRKALNDWIAEHHASAEERDAFLRALPELKTGEAFVWAPDFPEDHPLGLQRTKILACDTFNSHATPKVGEKRVEPKELTPVDLARLAKAMSATVEKAKQDDPAELRRTIATLRRENAALQKETAPTTLEVKYVDRAVLKDGQLARAEKIVDRLTAGLEQFRSWHHTTVAELSDAIAPITSALSAVSSSTDRTRGGTPGQEPVRRPEPGRTPLDGGTAVRADGKYVRASEGSRPSADSETKAPARTTLPLGERKVLISIAQHGEATRQQITQITGYKRSTRDAYVVRLVNRGYAELNGGGTVRATAEGVAALGPDYEPLPTGDALREYWLTAGRLPAGELAILEVLCDAFPKPLQRASLEEDLGYKRSTRDAYIARLLARKLVREAGRGTVIAAEELFG